MNQREQLIEDAAKAIYEVGMQPWMTAWEDAGDDYVTISRARAEAALAVFDGAANVSEPGVADISSEQMSVSAYAPTDDERCPMSVHHYLMAECGSCDYRREGVGPDDEQRFADRLYEVGLRSPESTKALLVFEEFRRTVQGEPSDAQVLATFNAFFGTDLTKISEGSAERVRAALRAAAETPEPDLIDCPHWEPGFITKRRACTACAAETGGEHRGS